MEGVSAISKVIEKLPGPLKEVTLVTMTMMMSIVDYDDGDDDYDDDHDDTKKGIFRRCSGSRATRLTSTTLRSGCTTRYSRGRRFTFVDVEVVYMSDLLVLMLILMLMLMSKMLILK